MKRAPLLLLILVFGLLAIPSDQTRYYLTEAEFLSQQSVPQYKVRGLAHIRGDYDANGRLMVKSIIDVQGNSTKFERYSYDDSSGEISTKEIIVDDSVVVSKTTFGHEHKTEAYIEYVYSVDTVKRWEDRFTVQEFNDIGKVKTYRFLDVDAFEYGNIWFEYDSLGHMSKQEWITQPSGKTMRKWLYAFDPETQVTHILEYDSTNTLVFEINLAADGTEVILYFSFPEDSAFVNHSQIGYRLDGDLEYGFLAWTLSDSTQLYLHDTLRYKMSGAEIKGGEHLIEWNVDSMMVDSMEYDVIFTGYTTKGYVANKRFIRNLNFDVSPPQIKLNVNPHINKAEIAYEFSEPVNSAFTVWIPDTVFSDAAIDTIILTESELIPDSGKIELTNQTALRDSAVYSLSMIVTDRAGNVSDPVTADSIHFDITRPVFILTEPRRSSYVNHGQTAFETDELIQSWTLEVQQTGGRQDVNAPHTVSRNMMPGEEMQFSMDVTNEVMLVDGAEYRFIVSGVDLAGNSSESVQADSVRYDVTPPVLTLIYPITEAAIREPSVSFAFSEDLQAAEFRWDQTSGSADSLSPRIITLVNDELKRGEKIRIKLENEPVLRDGSVYAITLSGMDLAGNEGELMRVQEVLFDASPPEFTDLKPDDGTALNHKKISYTVSEKLHEGSVTWTHTGGKDDPEERHRINLAGLELETGQHSDLNLSKFPNVVDGGIYSIVFRGSDRAGNQSDTLIIEDVLYDFTKPVIAVSHPKNGMYLNHKHMTYLLSENLHEGRIVWTRTGGMDDPNAPYNIVSDDKDKTEGSHSEKEISGMPEVVENVVYTISFSGSDRAGNLAEKVSVSGITYDFTPPEIALTFPESGMAVNHKEISFSLSEDLLSGTAVWTRTGGSADPRSSHEQPLTGNELNQGEKSRRVIARAPLLVDGSIYSLSISGSDPAGNQSNVPLMENILYDITAPVITAISPNDDEYIPTPAVRFSVSEDIEQGSVVYRRVGGKPDSNAPYVFGLENGLLKKGEHADVFLTGGPELVEQGIYTIEFSGRDRAENASPEETIQRVIFDSTPPELTVAMPKENSAVNHIMVSLGNSENLKTASIIWTQTGGNLDQSSPRIVQLDGGELNEGFSENILLKNRPSLVDGAIYDLKYFASDFAGNTSDTVHIRNILYDVTPPEISILSPGNNTITTLTNITFFLSEDIASGRIEWAGTGSGGESLLEFFDLTAEAARIGTHESDTYVIPDLVDGGNYSITISGTDPAGNEALPVSITDYLVDRTPPEFSELLPISDSYINSEEIGFTVSEDLASGRVTFSGKNAFSAELTGSELKEGTFPPGHISNMRNLSDGEVYSVSIVGKDFAGNESEVTESVNILYDISPPELTVLEPEDGSFITVSDVTISLNEHLAEGSLAWISSEGAESRIALDSLQLQKGRHVIQGDVFTIQENIPNTITFSGTDLAGNEGSAMPIEDVTFDGTPPEVILTGPVPNTAVNHKRISFSTNEILSEGEITWTAVKGSDPKSPHKIALSGDLLLVGDHNDVVMDVADLADGVTYNVAIRGKDQAKNASEISSVESVRYDITKPVFSEISPAGDTLINALSLSYLLSEDLAEGKISIGKTDKSAKGQFDLNLDDNRLKAGIGGGNLPASVGLENGSVYEIFFYGIDFAGNETDPTYVTRITFDDEKPNLALFSPESDSYVNTVPISFGISENLREGTVTLTENGKSPKKVVLAGENLNAGNFNDIILSGLDKWNDGGVYSLSISGTDLAGNVGDTDTKSNIIYDISPPEISVFHPVDGGEIRAEQLSYAFSEDVREAVLTITRTDGVTDSRSPHTVKLTGNELKSGRKDSLRLSNSPNLVNGAIYDLSMSATDFAGNEADVVTIKRVGFDNEPPVVSISQPVDAEQIKTSIVSYMVSDDLAWGKISFTQSAGTNDPNSPHIVALGVDHLSQGMHAEFDLGIIDNLADGGRYTIAIEGGDRAGNVAKVSQVRNVLFDIKPPVLSLSYPEPGSVVNHTNISYASTENMMEGAITFAQTGGVTDPNSPHVFNLSGSQLTQGSNEQVSIGLDPPLSDGSIYTISFDAMDLAGNISETVTLTGIVYDISAPLLAITAPNANSYHQALSIDFSTGELLDRGSIEIARSKGNPDIESPHIIDLESSYLSSGQHSMNISAMLPLKSGTDYMITISGSDKAGNISAPATVENVYIDFDPPDLEITSPVATAFVNHTRFGIRSSENLTKAAISWIHTAGTPDPSSPHEIALTGQYLIAGKFDNILLNTKPDLVSGATYSMALSGTDLAGNASTANLTEFYFDDAAPVFTHFAPQNGDFINTANLQFEIDEQLISGSITWLAEGGSQDPQSTRKIPLSESEKEGGLLDLGTLASQTELNDGTVYSITADGTDRAGNTITTELASGLTYDVSKPKFSGLFPTMTSRINSPLVKYTVNEQLQSGSFTWKHMGGEDDPNAPHEIAFDEGMLISGAHTSESTEVPSLVTGTMYRITFEGMDLAGNVGKKLIMNIVYDDIPPALELLYPEKDMIVNNTMLAYKISEGLTEGTIVYTQTGGNSDPMSPHSVKLRDLELEVVQLSPAQLSNSATLNDGSIYQVEFYGKDLAMNESSAPSIGNVLYDITKPELSLSKPEPNKVMVGPNVSYAVTENLTSATATFSRDGGNADVHSPHTITFTNAELAAGDYLNINLANMPELSPGTEYTLTISGTDMAGNESNPATVTGITYARSLEGNWYWQGPIMQVVWTFTPEAGPFGLSGEFAEGAAIGTKISNQTIGTFSIDYSSTPWILETEKPETGEKRFSLIEFMGPNRIKVLTKEKRKPSSWSDGEIMEYEYKP